MTIRKTFGASTEALSDLRQVRVICSTPDADRVGDIVIQSGIDFKAYMASGAGPVLWNHDSNIVIAKCIDISVVNGCLSALVQFPDEGQDEESDRYYGKIKFGSVSGVSIGFNPIDQEPLDAKNVKRGPQKYISSELMEFSFTPIPANRGATVQERSLSNQAQVWKVGSSLNLPAVPVLASVPDVFLGSDLSSLRKSTLIYDASNVDDIQSYQAPFAELHDGEWIVTRASLRNAKKFLETADLPETIRTKSQAVIQSYEAKMPVSILSDKIEVKSMWQVARFASLLSELGWLQDEVNWEAEWEADGSTVPAQLGDALVSLGNVFLAMATEEVSELLASVNTTNADADGTTKTFCAPNASPVVKSIMAAHAKAGAKFSGETVTTIRDALAAIGTGHQSLSKMLDDTSDDTGDDSDTDKASQIAQQKRARTLKLLSLGA